MDADEYQKVLAEQADLRKQYSDRTEALNTGTFGTVYRVRGEFGEVAIKVNKQKCVTSDVVREISLLREMKHRNVVELKDIFMESLSLALVFEFANYDLHGVIKRCELPAEYVMIITKQILEGMKYLHDNYIVHRDMKPGNVLMVSQATGKGGPAVHVSKVADFGLARVFKDPLRGFNKDGPVVTSWYRAPELQLNSLHYTTAVDIWSVGCMVAEMLNHAPLFHNKKDPPNTTYDEGQLRVMYEKIGPPDHSDRSSEGTANEWRHWRDCVHTEHWKRAEIVAAEIQASGRPTSSPYKLLHQGISDKVKSYKKEVTEDHRRFCEVVSQMLTYNPNIRITAAQALNTDIFRKIKSDLPAPLKLKKKKLNNAGREPSAKRIPPPRNHGSSQGHRGGGHHGGRQQQQRRPPVTNSRRGGGGGGGVSQYHGGRGAGGGAPRRAGHQGNQGRRL